MYITVYCCRNCEVEQINSPSCPCGSDEVVSIRTTTKLLDNMGIQIGTCRKYAQTIKLEMDRLSVFEARYSKIVRDLNIKFRKAGISELPETANFESIEDAVMKTTALLSDVTLLSGV